MYSLIPVCISTSVGREVLPNVGEGGNAVARHPSLHKRNSVVHSNGNVHCAGTSQRMVSKEKPVLFQTPVMSCSLFPIMEQLNDDALIFFYFCSLSGV